MTRSQGRVYNGGAPPTTEEITVNQSVIEEIKMGPSFACPVPGCDAFPYDTPGNLAAHVVEDHAVAQTPPRLAPPVVATERYQTVPNGFGGTTAVKVPPPVPTHNPDVDEIAWPEGAVAFAALVTGHYQDRKFVDIDVTSNLRDLAYNWLGQYRGTFEYAVEMKSNLAQYKRLSVGQVRGVLNCMRADVLRAAKMAAPAVVNEAAGFDLRTLPQSAHGVLHTAIPDQKEGHILFLDFAQRAGKVVVLQMVGGNEDLYLGTQPHGHVYTGKRTAEIEAVLADPKAAIEAYGHHAVRCGICNTPLSLEESRERGMGAKCAAKAGW